MSSEYSFNVNSEPSAGSLGRKSAPRMGAASGQGNGIGGYNSAAVGKAFSEIPGAPPKPTYFTGGAQK